MSVRRVLHYNWQRQEPAATAEAAWQGAADWLSARIAAAGPCISDGHGSGATSAPRCKQLLAHLFLSALYNGTIHLI